MWPAERHERAGCCLFGGARRLHLLFDFRQQVDGRQAVIDRGQVRRVGPQRLDRCLYSRSRCGSDGSRRCGGGGGGGAGGGGGGGRGGGGVGGGFWRVSAAVREGKIAPAPATGCLLH